MFRYGELERLCEKSSLLGIVIAEVPSATSALKAAEYPRRRAMLPVPKDWLLLKLMIPVQLAP